MRSRDRPSHGDRHDWDANAGEKIDELIVAAGVFPAERAGDNRLETTLIQAGRDYLHMGTHPGDRRLNDMEDSHTQPRDALGRTSARSSEATAIKHAAHYSTTYSLPQRFHSVIHLQPFSRCRAADLGYNRFTATAAT